MTPHVHSVHQKAFFSTEYNKRQKRGEHCPHLLPVRGGLFAASQIRAVVDMAANKLKCKVISYDANIIALPT